MKAYRLIAIEVADGRQVRGRRRALETALGVFSTVANAERMVRIHADRVKGAAKMLGYALYENDMDDIAPHGPWKDTPEFLSARTYLADGSLNAFCDCDNACERQWHGRDAATIRFRRGDFVSVWHGDTISTELVGETPITTERKITGDWSDDCYLTYVADGGHEHPFTPYVFPLVGTLTADVRAKLEAARDNDLAGV